MTSKSFRFASFTLDLERLCLQGPAGRVDLRRKSFDVLRYLAEHAGRVVAKEELIKAVWPDVTVSDDSLTQCVSEIRRAIGDTSRTIIKTVPRRGYLLEGTDERSVTQAVAGVHRGDLLQDHEAPERAMALDRAARSDLARAPRIELRGVCVTLRERTGTLNRRQASTFAIQDLTLRVPGGQTMVVLGPSGCGKTTVLKLIAGLLQPDAGDVLYDGVDVKDLSPGDRRIGMVFQNYALYPHFASRTNVLSYFLFRKKTPTLDALARAKFERTSELMGVELGYLLDRKPTRLSGGEKQRVALGRCITRDAAVFLVDEPFANLDPALREKYRVNLKLLLRQFNVTTVYVTHDHHEALLLADVLAVMDRGRIEQVGTLQEIYNAPKNIFVAGFVNANTSAPPINLIDGRWMRQGDALARAWVGVRPEEVEMSGEARGDALEGTVAERVTLPPRNTTLLTIRVGEHEVHTQTGGEDGHRVGDPVWLTFKRYHVFDKASGLRLRSYDGAGMVLLP